MSVYEFLASASLIAAVLYILWYLFFTDSDTVLAIADKFGCPVSYFKGKVVWMTGASAGLGEAMANELASVGAKLILSARNEEMLEKVKDDCLVMSCGKLEKKDILVLPFDVCDHEAQKTAVKRAVEHFGQIDMLVNNAGRYQIGSVIDTQTEVSRDLFEVNFFGGANLAKLVLKHFLEKGKGQILVVSSIAGKFGVPSSASYCATKHALKGFYESLRYEYHKDNVAVTLVYPGIFKSSIFGRAMSSEKGKIFEKDFGHYECTQMTSERCAHLTLVAAANKLFEAWIAYQPFLLMLCMAQYLPLVEKYFMLKYIYTRERVENLLKGMWPNDLPVWRPILYLQRRQKKLLLQ